MTPALRARVAEYGSFHRHPVNRALHVLGIPLLGVGSLGLLSQLAIPVGVGVPALEPNAAWLFVLAAAGWYLVLDRRAGWPVLATVVACYAVGSFLPGPVLAGLWVTGAAAHLVGHYGFEGKRAAGISDPTKRSCRRPRGRTPEKRAAWGSPLTSPTRRTVW